MIQRFGSGPLSSRSHRQAVTLVLVLLVLALLAAFLARQSLHVASLRIASAGRSFQLQAAWLAEGIALQWLERAQDPGVDIPELLRSSVWKVDELIVEVKAASSQNKLSLQEVKPARWLPLWRRLSGTVQANNDIELVDDPQQTLIAGGYYGVECLLGPRHASGRDAYLAGEGLTALADLLTIWGEGKVDLNRASRDVLAAALPRFTDAQISGILRLRSKEPLGSFILLARELSLSDDQLKTLQEVGVFAPRRLELVIRLRQGKMSAVYLAVLDLAQDRVLEVRAIP